ncbi:hypothetical protein ACROYT_G015109 [Oculina patagonica]
MRFRSENNNLITAVKDALAQARKQNAETEKELSTERKQLDEQGEELKELYDLQENLEQCTRKNLIDRRSDMSRAYDWLQDKGHRHLTVNHDLNFEDPDTGRRQLFLQSTPIGGARRHDLSVSPLPLADAADISSCSNEKICEENSGKPNKTQVREFDDPVASSAFHESDKYDIRYVSVLTEQRVEIHFKHKVEDDPVSPNLNIFVAAFTTCWARLRLYEALDLLQEQVLYFDTDSVVFVSRPGEQNPSLADYLGDFKDELSTGDYIVEFASGGPKNYGFVTKNGKEESKVRGISLNSEGAKQLNYKILRQNVIDDIQQPLESRVQQTDVVKPYHIVRNAIQYAIETVPQTKTYQMVFSKRVIDTASFYTYPYGYSQWDPRPDVEAEELMDSAELNEQDKRNIEVLMDL